MKVDLIATLRLTHSTPSRVSIELLVPLDRSRAKEIPSLDLSVFKLFISAAAWIGAVRSTRVNLIEVFPLAWQQR